MHYVLNYYQGIVEAKTYGDSEISVFRELINAILNYENWEPGGRLFVDHSELNAGPLTVEEVYEIALICEQNSERFGQGKCAHFVARDLEFGMVRMWEMLVENRWNMTTMVFRSKDKAIEWLLN